MLRLSKMTDYAIVLLTYVASGADRETHAARQLALSSGLPLPTVSKVLKMISRAGLLVSVRGKHGGYRLVRDAKEVSVADIICAIEGPVSLTECGARQMPLLCDFESSCPVRENWRTINGAVTDALAQLSLEDMTHPLRACAGHSHEHATVDTITRPLLELVK